MSIYAYEGIPQEEIMTERVTSEGKTYTLNHPDGLVVDMRYKGEGKSNSNSQGWERSSSYYFEELQKSHPKYFSKRNTARIEHNESPKVDAQFVKSFPQYEEYMNETLIHHHVGKDGQAVAVPQSMHKGSGEIHMVENKLGITDNAREFSDSCKEKCDKDKGYFGETADKFKEEQSKVLKEEQSKVTESKQDAVLKEEMQNHEAMQTHEELMKEVETQGKFAQSDTAIKSNAFTKATDTDTVSASSNSSKFESANNSIKSAISDNVKDSSGKGHDDGGAELAFEGNSR